MTGKEVFPFDRAIVLNPFFKINADFFLSLFFSFPSLSLYHICVLRDGVGGKSSEAHRPQRPKGDVQSRKSLFFPPLYVRRDRMERKNLDGIIIY